MEKLEIQINNFFAELKFEQTQHKYTVGNMFIPSVSVLLKKFTEPFNSKDISKFVAIKQGVSQQEVLKQWDDKKNEACDRGHRIHDFAEHYAFNRNLQPSCNQEIAVTKFWNDIPEHIIPFKMELQMFHKEFLFAGTCDVLLYDTFAKKFILCDYKTNEDLFKNYKQKKLLYPFNLFLDNNFNKYQIQLSFYQLLFEQLGFDYKIGARKLIWLLPDGTYKMYDTQDLTYELKEYLIKRN